MSGLYLAFRRQPESRHGYLGHWLLRHNGQTVASALRSTEDTKRLRQGLPASHKPGRLRLKGPPLVVVVTGADADETAVGERVYDQLELELRLVHVPMGFISSPCKFHPSEKGRGLRALQARPAFKGRPVDRDERVRVTWTMTSLGKGRHELRGFGIEGWEVYNPATHKGLFKRCTEWGPDV
jgi:hypothetical protein